MVNARKLGDRARARRRELRLSIEQVAAKVGLSAAHVSRLETGKVGASPDLIEKFSAVLGMPADAILAESETELVQLAAEVERTRPEKVDMVKGFLRAVLMLSTFTVLAGGVSFDSSRPGNDGPSLHNAYPPRRRIRKGQASATTCKAA